MIHRTYRSLDAPIKLIGFTLRQWVAIVLGAGAVIAVVHVAHLPGKAAISLCTLVIGVPVAVTYVSEGGGLQLSTLLRDCWHWRWRAHQLPANCPPRARLLGVVVQTGADSGQTEVAEDAVAVDLRELLNGERWNG